MSGQNDVVTKKLQEVKLRERLMPVYLKLCIEGAGIANPRLAKQCAEQLTDLMLEIELNGNEHNAAELILQGIFKGFAVGLALGDVAAARALLGALASAGGEIRFPAGTNIPEGAQADVMLVEGEGDQPSEWVVRLVQPKPDEEKMRERCLSVIASIEASVRNGVRYTLFNVPFDDTEKIIDKMAEGAQFDLDQSGIETDVSKRVEVSGVLEEVIKAWVEEGSQKAAVLDKLVAYSMAKMAARGDG